LIILIFSCAQLALQNCTATTLKQKNSLYAGFAHSKLEASKMKKLKTMFLPSNLKKNANWDTLFFQSAEETIAKIDTIKGKNSDIER